MKTAISLPDELFDQIDRCSRQLKVSRSRLLADAAREYLARRRMPVDATAAWNEVIDEVGQPGDDPAAIALRRRSKAVLGTALRKRR
jgi:predicted transcriptional regulator